MAKNAGPVTTKTLNQTANVIGEQNKIKIPRSIQPMEEQMKAGTFNTASDGKGTKKEAMKYTGDSIVGIANA